MPNFQARKFPEELSGRDTRELHESSDCFEYPKNSLLKLTTQKNTCPNFPTQKKILRSSLSPGEAPAVTWDLEYPSWG